MEESSGENCIFCDIVAGKAEAHRIHEDSLSLGILDINPFTRGHCLVIPKRHVPWWHDLAEEETESLFGVARILARRIMEAFRPDFVCMYARGRRIPHTHVFLVPTYAGDLLDRYFNALEKFQESPDGMVRIKDRQALEQAADLLRAPSFPST